MSGNNTYMNLDKQLDSELERLGIGTTSGNTGGDNGSMKEVGHTSAGGVFSVTTKDTSNGGRGGGSAGMGNKNKRNNVSGESQSLKSVKTKGSTVTVSSPSSRKSVASTTTSTTSSSGHKNKTTSFSSVNYVDNEGYQKQEKVDTYKPEHTSANNNMQVYDDSYLDSDSEDEHDRFAKSMAQKVGRGRPGTASGTRSSRSGNTNTSSTSGSGSGKKKTKKTKKSRPKSAPSQRHFGDSSQRRSRQLSYAEQLESSEKLSHRTGRDALLEEFTVRFVKVKHELKERQHQRDTALDQLSDLKKELKKLKKEFARSRDANLAIQEEYQAAKHEYETEYRRKMEVKKELKEMRKYKTELVKQEHVMEQEYQHLKYLYEKAYTEHFECEKEAKKLSDKLEKVNSERKMFKVQWKDAKENVEYYTRQLNVLKTDLEELQDVVHKTINAVESDY